jgi:hypothetical protein
MSTPRVCERSTTARFKSRRRFIKTSAIARGDHLHGQFYLAATRKLPEFYHVDFPGCTVTIFTHLNRENGAIIFMKSYLNRNKQLCINVICKRRFPERMNGFTYGFKSAWESLMLMIL